MEDNMNRIADRNRDPRHLPNAEERKKTTEPLNERTDNATADAEQLKRPRSYDPSNHA
jgi:hypothetical protein